MTISDWLKKSSAELQNAAVDSARLDAEIILAHTLNKSRTWLHAHSDEHIDERRREIADTRIELRKDHTPIAYITGHKEFYGRPFKVTPSTLIPRPESENLIDLLKKHSSPNHKNLIDVGTGSGCLGITAKLELPALSVSLSDISRHTLSVAEKNARNLHASVQTIESDLLPSGGSYDIILANLPYVDSSWERNKETDFEPELALFANDNGLELIKKLIDQSARQITSSGLLLLEADPRQMVSIRAYASSNDFTPIETSGFATVFRK